MLWMWYVALMVTGFTLVGNSDQFALSGLKSISQSCSLLGSSCRDSASSSVLMWRYSRQSSAKRRALALTLDGRSLMKARNSRAFVCLFCCLRSQVNSYGHCGTVSSPNHTFSWAGLNKRFTSNSCTYFRL